MDDPFVPLKPRRWPWMVAILASLLWAAAVLVMAAGTPLPPALARALPALIGLMAPVAVVWLAMLHLRDAGAVAAARAAIADARTQQAAEWLEHSAASLARLEEQLTATTDRLAAMETPVVDHARAVTSAASAIERANVQLNETVAQAVAAGSNVAGVVPAATSQAETLIELLGRAENTLRAQRAETETLLAGLYTRASEAESEARRAAPEVRLGGPHEGSVGLGERHRPLRKLETLQLGERDSGRKRVACFFRHQHDLLSCHALQVVPNARPGR